LPAACVERVESREEGVEIIWRAEPVKIEISIEPHRGRAVETAEELVEVIGRHRAVQIRVAGPSELHKYIGCTHTLPAEACVAPIRIREYTDSARAIRARESRRGR